MAKKYIYDGVEYYSTYTLRQDIWEKEHKVFVTPTDAAGWQLLGVTYIEEDDPEPTLEDQKAMKLAMLERAFLQWYENDATLTSSLVAAEGRSAVYFRGKDNQFYPLTLEQLKILQIEIIDNGNYAYQQKWDMEQAVSEATNKSELDAIEIKFVGKDFSEAAE